jgi:hypothetical protein
VLTEETVSTRSLSHVLARRLSLSASRVAYGLARLVTRGPNEAGLLSGRSSSTPHRCLTHRGCNPVAVVCRWSLGTSAFPILVAVRVLPLPARIGGWEAPGW